MGQAVEDGVESEQGVISAAQSHGGQEETADQEGEVSQTQAGQQRGEDGPHLPDITGRITISPASHQWTSALTFICFRDYQGGPFMNQGANSHINHVSYSFPYISKKFHSTSHNFSGDIRLQTKVLVKNITL